MKKRESLKQKAFRLWKAAGLPKFLNKYGPKVTPGWVTFLCHIEYTVHAPAWRRVNDFMINYHKKKRHFTTWQKAIQKWPAQVWDALAQTSAGEEKCEIAAIN